MLMIYMKTIRLSNAYHCGTLMKKEYAMIESQIAVKQMNEKRWNEFLDQTELREVYEALPEEVYKDGVVSGKMKRMMALVGALVSGCRACILYQTDNALKLGASVEEIFEACAVAVSLGGSMASGEAARVVEYLKEVGELA